MRRPGVRIPLPPRLPKAARNSSGDEERSSTGRALRSKKTPTNTESEPCSRNHTSSQKILNFSKLFARQGPRAAAFQIGASGLLASCSQSLYGSERPAVATECGEKSKNFPCLESVREPTNQETSANELAHCSVKPSPPTASFRLSRTPEIAAATNPPASSLSGGIQGFGCALMKAENHLPVGSRLRTLVSRSKEKRPNCPCHPSFHS